MEKSKRLAISGLMFVFVTILLFLACTSEQKADSEFYTIWFKDSQEYRTNDMEVAQKETPFTIILPTYLPVDLIIHPFFEGRARSAFSDDIPLSIMYYRTGDSFPYVDIEEYSKSISILSSDNSNYLELSDIEVLEQETAQFSFTSMGEATFIPGFTYAWNNDGVYFYVRIMEYQLDEARKIVESMIILK